MSYVDGFVIPVPEKKLKTYVRMAKMGKEMWLRHGALDYKECVGEDLENKWGTTFSKMMKLKPGETLKLLFDNPSSGESISAMCANDGNEIVEQVRDAGKTLRWTILKQ